MSRHFVQLERTPGVVCGLALTSTYYGTPWLTVLCKWCDGKIPGGCFMCLPHHVELKRLLADPERVRLRQAVRTGDKEAALVLRDWYKENASLVEGG